MKELGLIDKIIVKIVWKKRKYHETIGGGEFDQRRV